MAYWLMCTLSIHVYRRDICHIQSIGTAVGCVGGDQEIMDILFIDLQHRDDDQSLYPRSDDCTDILFVHWTANGSFLHFAMGSGF